MLVENYNSNFKYKYSKNRMIVYFSDTPTRLLNIYNLKQKIPEEEFTMLKEYFINMNKEGLVKFFEFHKDIFLSLGREKIYLCLKTDPTISCIKYLTPSVFEKNINLSDISFLRKSQVKEKRKEWDNNESMREAVQNHLKYFTIKQIEKRLLKYVKIKFSKDNIWNIFDKQPIQYRFFFEDEYLLRLSLLSTIYFYNSPF
jgi:hypothetical protein